MANDYGVSFINIPALNAPKRSALNSFLQGASQIAGGWAEGMKANRAAQIEKEKLALERMRLKQQADLKRQELAGERERWSSQIAERIYKTLSGIEMNEALIEQRPINLEGLRRSTLAIAQQFVNRPDWAEALKQWEDERSVVYVNKDGTKIAWHRPGMDNSEWKTVGRRDDPDIQEKIKKALTHEKKKNTGTPITAKQAGAATRKVIQNIPQTIDTGIQAGLNLYSPPANFIEGLTGYKPTTPLDIYNAFKTWLGTIPAKTEPSTMTPWPTVQTPSSLPVQGE